MQEITIDGMEEGAFRRSVEHMLRHGEAEEAVARLRALLADYCGEGGILPACFLGATAEDITFAGWDRIGDKLRDYDRPGQRITALHFDVRDPLEIGTHPDEEGCLAPCIETSFFSDSAFPFSEALREDLLEGYSVYGCEWQGNYEHAETILTVRGIDDLYGAIVLLEEKVAASELPDADEIRAGAIGACYVSVLVHRALQETAIRQGLPRPLCILAGSSDAYPFFDAPAVTLDEYLTETAMDLTRDESAQRTPTSPDETPEGEELFGELDSAMASLADCGLIRKTTKKQAIVFADAAEAAAAIEEGALAAAGGYPGWDVPPPETEPREYGDPFAREGTGAADPDEVAGGEDLTNDPAGPERREVPADTENDASDWDEDVWPVDEPSPAPPLNPPHDISEVPAEAPIHPEPDETPEPEPRVAGEDHGQQDLFVTGPAPSPASEPFAAEELTDAEPIAPAAPIERPAGSAIRRKLITQATPPPPQEPTGGFLGALARLIGWIKRS